MRGQVDLWFEEAGGRVVIVDYKTDRFLDAGRERGYTLQLQCYALALERLLGPRPMEAWLFPLRTGQPQRVDLNAGRDVLASLQALAAAERSGCYEARAGEPCRWCASAGPACPEGARL